MSYLLDTNHCVYLKNAIHKRSEKRTSFEANVFKSFQQVKSQNKIYVSVVSFGELYFGAEKSRHKEKNYKKIEFFKKHIHIETLNDEIWRLFGATKAALAKQGKNITDFDLLIACTAKANNHTLVSNDSDHKVILEDFLLENWTL